MEFIYNFEDLKYIIDNTFDDLNIQIMDNIHFDESIKLEDFERTIKIYCKNYMFSSDSENMFELNFKNNNITFEGIHFFKFSNNLFLIKNGKLQMSNCIIDNNNKNSDYYIDIHHTDGFILDNCTFFAHNLTNISIKNDFKNIITENCNFIKLFPNH